MHLGFTAFDAHPKDMTLALWINPNGGQHRQVKDYTAFSHFLIARIHLHKWHGLQSSLPPLFEDFIQLSGGS
jgi:hypothetical protein